MYLAIRVLWLFCFCTLCAGTTCYDMTLTAPTQSPTLDGEPACSNTICTVSSLQDLRKRIAEAPAGLTIRLKAGDYPVDETIVIARDDLRVEGEGPDTCLFLMEGTRCPVLVIGEPAPQPVLTHSRITVRNLRIRGFRVSNPRLADELCHMPGREHLRNNGLTLRQVNDCCVRGVTVDCAASAAVGIEKSCRNLELVDLDLFDAQCDGIALDGDIRDSLIESCDVHHNGASGISLDLGPIGNRVHNCRIHNNKTVGVFVRDSDENCFKGCTIEENGADGAFIADGNAIGADAVLNTFIENAFLNNGGYGIWNAGSRSSNCESGGVFAGNGASDRNESFPIEAPLLDCAYSDGCSG